MNKFLLCALLTTTVFVSASSKDAGRTRSKSRAEQFLAAFDVASGKDVVPGKGGVNGNSPTAIMDSVFSFDLSKKSQERAAAFERSSALQDEGLTPVSVIGSLLVQKLGKLNKKPPFNYICMGVADLNSGNPKEDNLFDVYASRLPIGAVCDLVSGVKFQVIAKFNDIERKTKTDHGPAMMFKLMA